MLFKNKNILVTRENLVGVRVIRAFNQQEKECAQFDEESNLLLKSQKYVGKIAGLLNPLTYIVINVAIIMIIWVGLFCLRFSYTP